jgi:hypothetical protein
MMDWGSVPQWITAGVALAALAIAWLSIQSQREIARKRAAIDFFTKTEMDKHTLDQHKKFKEAVEKLKEHLASKRSLDDFLKMAAYWDIRDYLNLHELMGVGINRDVFDDYVCEDFWAGELRRAHQDTKPLIEHIQKLPGESETYVELCKVRERWGKRE